ncbi:glycine-rich protein-like [Nicotiana sylvestris]|uniref:Glycine-rich protein-like n=1 Tax=Nicotiana sylvestris TaxID=4096 RepID=A0A1U7VBS9_NICSY|nr:PREDICTED: glycine-rich protein-like [Nicotiana sylvestris]
MGFKAFIVLSFALAIFLFLTSEVAARELAESSTNSLEISKKSEKNNDVNDAKYPGGGYRGYPGGGYGVYPGGGYRGYPGGGYGGYPGGGRGRGRGGYGGEYCRYGCCGRRDYYGCRRCCYNKGEAMEKFTEAKPRN